MDLERFAPLGEEIDKFWTSPRTKGDHLVGPQRYQHGDVGDQPGPGIVPLHLNEHCQNGRIPASLPSSGIDFLDLWAFVEAPFLVFDLFLFDLFDPYNRRIGGYQFDIGHIILR